MASSLSAVDSEMYNLIKQEEHRQCTTIYLTASENFTSVAVIEALGSIFANKNTERSGKRSYGAASKIDELGDLCASRAVEAFCPDPTEWGVNVRPYSSSPANFAVYTALLQPQDHIMGLNLPSSDHCTHGNSGEKNISAISILFDCLPYKVSPADGYIDYDELEKNAESFKPKLIICGGSAYPREWNYERLKEIATECGAWLLCDMSDITGFVLTDEKLVSPFVYCDVVTTTTHTSLRGPQSAMIFYRKDAMLENKINKAVFPTLQDAPRENQIASLAVALKQAKLPEFLLYIQQAKKNADALGEFLKKKEYTILTGGTDNHLLLWDLSSLRLTGSSYVKVCDLCNITLNEHDTSSGVCISTLAMTSRGLTEEDFKEVGEFLHEAIDICRELQTKHGKLLENINEGGVNSDKIEKLKSSVEDFALSFEIPGFNKSS